MSEEKQDKPKGLQLGPEIYNESCLTPEEWKIQSKKYPGTYQMEKPPMFFKSDYEWRWRMGGNLTKEEVNLINTRIDKLIKEVQNANPVSI